MDANRRTLWPAVDVAIAQCTILPECVEREYEHPRGCAQHDCLLYEPIAVLTLRHDVFAPFVCRTAKREWQMRHFGSNMLFCLNRGHVELLNALIYRYIAFIFAQTMCRGGSGQCNAQRARRGCSDCAQQHHSAQYQWYYSLIYVVSDHCHLATKIEKM